jgi:hypothetical protein
VGVDHWDATPFYIPLTRRPDSSSGLFVHTLINQLPSEVCYLPPLLVAPEFRLVFCEEDCEASALDL